MGGFAAVRPPNSSFHGGYETGENLPPQEPPQKPQRMPDVMRIVTNYVDNQSKALPIMGGQPQLDENGNDVNQDIHTLLVLLDALRQADHHVMQRVAGSRPAPMP